MQITCDMAKSTLITYICGLRISFSMLAHFFQDIVELIFDLNWSNLYEKCRENNAYFGLQFSSDFARVL